MRRGMERLAGFLARRRLLVIGVWLVFLVAALPLGARQTEELTGGGFSVPGSESQQVEDAVEESWQDTREGAISVVLEPAQGTGPEDAAAGVERMSEAVATVPEVGLPPGATTEAERVLAAGQVAVVPLRTELPTDRQTDAATDLREALEPGEEADGVTPYLAGQRDGQRGGDRARRHPRAADPRAGRDAAHGALELVAAGVARPAAPGPRLRGPRPQGRTGRRPVEAGAGAGLRGARGAGAWRTLRLGSRGS